MPIYEYHCADCDRSFERLVGRGEEAAECPRCGGGNIARELSVFAAARGGADPAGPIGGAGAAGCCGGGCGCR